MLDTMNGLFNNLIFQLIIGSCNFWGGNLGSSKKNMYRICHRYNQGFVNEEDKVYAFHSHTPSSFM